MASNEATIEAEISSHQYAKADADLRGVLAAKPDSAKAHYWLGQVLGYEGHAQDALSELARAKALDPSLAFTTPEAFHRVESELQSAASHAASSNRTNGGFGSNLGPAVGAATSAHVGSAASVPVGRHDPQTNESGFSTMNIFIGVVIVIALFMFFRRRSAPSGSSSMYPTGGVPPQGQVPPGYGGYSGGYPPGAPPAGGGLGSVVAGAAGGFILGEMLGHSRDAGATTVVHDIVHDSPSNSDSGSNYNGSFDAGSNDGGSFGGDSGGGFDSGGGGDF